MKAPTYSPGDEGEIRLVREDEAVVVIPFRAPTPQWAGEFARQFSELKDMGKRAQDMAEKLRAQLAEVEGYDPERIADTVDRITREQHIDHETTLGRFACLWRICRWDIEAFRTPNDSLLAMTQRVREQLIGERGLTEGEVFQVGCAFLEIVNDIVANASPLRSAVKRRIDFGSAASAEGPPSSY